MPFPSADPDLLRAITERGYAEATPVQAAVLQPDASGSDLLASAQTGSGKALAYALAIAPDLRGEAGRLEPGRGAAHAHRGAHTRTGAPGAA